MVLPIVGIISSVAKVGVKATATQAVKKAVKKNATGIVSEVVKPYKEVKKAVKKGKKAVQTVQEVKKALYRNKQGQLVIKQKAGRTSVKDPFMKAANAYLNKSGSLDIRRVYAYTSKVAHGTEGMWGVKLEDGSKGWIRENGTFVSQKDIGDVLRSVDMTNVMAREGISLEGMWNAMNAQEKADFAKVVDDFDWQSFWKEMYPAEGRGASDDAQTDLLYNLLAQLKVVKNW